MCTVRLIWALGPTHRYPNSDCCSLTLNTRSPDPCCDEGCGCDGHECWVLDIIFLDPTVPLQIDYAVECNRQADEQQGPAKEKPTVETKRKKASVSRAGRSAGSSLGLGGAMGTHLADTRPVLSTVAHPHSPGPVSNAYTAPATGGHVVPGPPLHAVVELCGIISEGYFAHIQVLGKPNERTHT